MQLEEIEVAFKLLKDNLQVRLHLTSSPICQPNFRYASVGRWKCASTIWMAANFLQHRPRREPAARLRNFPVASRTGNTPKTPRRGALPPEALSDDK